MEDLSDLNYIEKHLESLMFIAKIPDFDIDINTLSVNNLMLINVMGDILYNKDVKSIYTLNILDRLIFKEANIRWWIEWRIHKYEENYRLLDNYSVYDLCKEFKIWLIKTYEEINYIYNIPGR